MDRNSMKRVILYIGMMAASLAVTSCSDSWLDLNPSTSVTTDQALSTLTDIETALNGVYRETSLHSYYGDNYWYYGDCRAMDVQARVTKGDGRRVSPYYESLILSSVRRTIFFNVLRKEALKELPMRIWQASRLKHWFCAGWHCSI